MMDILLEAAKTGILTEVQKYDKAEWRGHRQQAIKFITEICLNGHLNVAMWLQETFDLTCAEARMGCNNALQCACSNGHLHVARWLHQTFSLNAEDAKMVNNLALRWACRGGHLSTAQWLQKTFGMTAENIGPVRNYLLQWPRENGHHHVVQWLCEAFDLPHQTTIHRWSPHNHSSWYPTLRACVLASAPTGFLSVAAVEQFYAT